MINESEGKIVVLDWAVFMYMAIFGTRRPGSMSSTYVGLSMILSCLRKIGIEPQDTVYLAVDFLKSWRKQYAEEYKADRKAKLDAHTDINWDKEYKAFNELLNNLNRGTDWIVVKGEHCLAGNTFIKVKNRDKYINQLKINDKVLTYNFKKKIFEYNKILKIYRHKTNEYLELEFFQNKTKLIITPEHKVYTNNGWRKAKNLKIKDVIYTYQDYQLLLNQKNQFMLGYLTGLVEGDGWIHRQKRACAISMCDLEPVKYAQFIIKKLTGKEYKIDDREARKVHWKRTKTITIYNKSFLQLLSDCMKNHGSNKEFMKGFLSAFYDAEGALGKTKEYAYGLIRISNTDKKLILYCQKILDVFKIEYKVYKFKNYNGNKRHKDIYRIDINKQKYVREFFEKFYPQIKRKTPETLKNGIQIRKINFIKNNNEIKTYNIETKNENYFANGMLVHNCEADDLASHIVRHNRNKEVVLVTIDGDWQQMWQFGDNVKIFSPKTKPRRYKVKPKNYNFALELAKKIKCERSDNLISEIKTEEDYEIRKMLVDLTTLPIFIEKQIDDIFANLKEKENIDINCIPYDSLREKIETLYNDKEYIVTYKWSEAFEERKTKRVANKRKKVKK